MSDSSSKLGEVAREATRSYYLWVVLALALGAMMADAFTGQGIPVLYPFIQEEFGLSRAQVGFITSAAAIGGMATIVLAGWLTDRLGVKRVITISLFALTAFMVAFLLAYSWPFILVLAAIVGVVSSPGYPATTRVVMDWSPRQIRALAMSIKQMGAPIGGAIAATVLPALTLVVGWRMAAALLGMLVLVVAIVFMMLYRDAPGSAGAAGGLKFSNVHTLLRDRSLMIPIIWGATFVGIQFIILSYFMLFLIEELHMSPIATGGLLAIAQVGSGIARVLWGAASDFLFHGRRMAILVVIGFATVIWLFIFSLMNAGIPNIIVLLMTIAIGISTLSFHGVFTALIGEVAGAKHIGVTAGLASMMHRVGMMAMPPFFGYLVDVSNSYSLGWRVAAAMALVSTLVLWVFGREPKRQ